MNLIDYKSIFFIVVLSFMNAAIECTHCKKDIKGEYYYLDMVNIMRTVIKIYCA